MVKDETIEPYVLINFANKEQLESTDYSCPLCRESSSLVTTDSFLKESKLYHGAKYVCRNCDESLITIDDGFLTKNVTEELQEAGVIRVEFLYNEVQDIIELEDDFFKQE